MTTHQPPAWSDAELDASLRDLAVELDGLGSSSPATADHDALAAVRARLLPDVGVASDHAATAEVLEIGVPRAGHPGRDTARRRRWAPALLVAAAVVVAVAVGAVVWPRADSATPPALPSSTASSAQDVVAARIRLLPDPVPPVDTGYTVLFTESGAGDASFGGAFSVPEPTDSAGRPLTLTYGFVCGDPTVGGDPNGSTNDASAYAVEDNLGNVFSGSCQPLGDGLQVGGYGLGSPPTAVGRDSVRIEVANPDVVWRLVVTVTPG